MLVRYKISKMVAKWKVVGLLISFIGRAAVDPVIPTAQAENTPMIVAAM